MEIVMLTIISMIVSVCSYELKIDNCNEVVNSCVDKKVWEFREKLYEPDTEMMEILLNECVEELKTR